MILQDGVLKNFCLSEYAARKTGRKRAANQSGSYFLHPGEQSLEELISGIKNGILINRFSGGRLAPAAILTAWQKTAFSLRTAGWQGAVTETMISGNFAELLQNLRGISRETVCDGYSVLPWAAFDGITAK